jgi:DEAD/DEAH box helicase domain-containing protein
VGSIGAGRVFAECHEGAIYLHRGRQYLVSRLDPEEHTVEVRPVNAPYYTRALSEKVTEILSRDRARPVGLCRLVQGRVKVTTTLTGFERRRVRGQDLMGTEPLDLPPTSFETVSIWIEVPDEIPAAVKAAERHPMGGLHAVEHAALSLFPLFALCDRYDVGGISHLHHADTKKATVFFYDGHPGGVGLSASLFDRAETLLETTHQLIEDCECEEGCPACVHSPKCGSGNRPIDKTAALQVLSLLLGREPLPALDPERSAAALPAVEPDIDPPLDVEEPQHRVLFVDIETQRSADEVGGWHNAHLMRIAVAVVFDTLSGDFESFTEGEVEALLARLEQADLVVGFNIRRFDYQVLRGYTDRDFDALPTFDMLEAIHQRLGFRLPLGHLAEETLGASKSADGLQSLEWWREGRVEEVLAYCRMDVALLRDLFDHAVSQGFLFFRTRDGQRVRLPARWSVSELVERARGGGAPASSRRADSTPTSRYDRTPPTPPRGATP